MKSTNLKIKSRREQLNYSQEYIAEHLGITQPAYVKIEQGVTKLNFERLIKISEILEIDVNELLEKEYIVNNFNNSESSTSIGLVENLHQENQKANELLVNTLLSQISDLREENKKLILIIEKFLSNKT